MNIEDTDALIAQAHQNALEAKKAQDQKKQKPNPENLSARQLQIDYFLRLFADVSEKDLQPFLTTFAGLPDKDRSTQMTTLDRLRKALRPEIPQRQSSPAPSAPAAHPA